MWRANWPLRGMLGQVASMAQLKATFDQSVPESADADLFLQGNYLGLPCRYMLSWLLHFGGLTATIQEDSLVVMNGSMRSDQPLFQHHAETNGAWVVRLKERLRQRVSVPAGKWDCGQLLQFVGYKSNVFSIVDPAVFPQGNAPSLHVEFHDEQVSTILDQLCTSLGFEQRFQGGVVFITREQNKREPKPARR